MELNPKEEKRFVKSDDIDVSFDSDFRRKTHDERWGESFQRLVDNKSVHGDCNVPYRCKEDPFLGRWGKSKFRALIFWPRSPINETFIPI